MEKKNHILLFRLIIIIFVCSLLLLSLCSCTISKSYNEARHSDAIKEILDEHGDLDTLHPGLLLILCDAYGQFKDYGRLFACLDCIQKKINQGKDVIDEIPVVKDAIYENLNFTLYYGRASAFLELGMFDEAIKNAQKGIDHFEKQDRRGWSAARRWYELHFIQGLAYARSNQADKARPYAKFFATSADNVMTCNWYSLSSMIYSAIGDYQLALYQANKYGECYQPNLEMYGKFGKLIRKSAGLDSTESLEINKDYLLGKTNVDVGNIDIAKKHYDILLSKENIIQNRGLYWVILFERGRISEKEGNLSEAVLYYARAVDVIEEVRTTLYIEDNKIGYAGDKQRVYYAIISLLFGLGKYQEALEYVERGKSRALVDMLASKKTFSAGKIDPKKLTTLIKELDEAERESVLLAYQTTSEDKAKDVRSLTLVKKTEIAQTSKELASLVSIRPTSIKDIQTIISPEETLVEFYYHGDTLFAFLVTQGMVKGVKLVGRGLNNDVIAFRKNMLDTLDQTRSITIKDVNPDRVADKSTAFRSLRDSGRSLYEKIFKPLEPMITTKNITIVPHGALHYVPFNALITDKGYLLDTYAIRILPSASVLQFLQTKRGGQTGELIAFGNPDLNDSKHDLSFAQLEALAITKGNPRAKVLLRKQASKTAVKKFSDQFRYVHFACHGIFNPDKPLESGLMLSKDEHNDGMLTVSELYDMRLNADLVTLSACETALGKVSNGDDVVGFTRGFLYAGTNSVVSSLWKVSDEATSILMQELYKNLKDKDKRTALRLAQLKVKETYNSHPYFWAAFQLTGAIK